MNPEKEQQAGAPIAHETLTDASELVSPDKDQPIFALFVWRLMRSKTALAIVVCAYAVGAAYMLWEGMSAEGIFTRILKIGGAVLFATFAFAVLTTGKRIRERFQKLSTGNINVGNLEEVKAALESWERQAFKENLRCAFILKSCHLGGFGLFSDCEWNLQPGVNVLLGRNGYGKTLLLRLIASGLKRDPKATEKLFSLGRAPVFEMKVQREREDLAIKRSPDGFTDKVGPIPLLAIADTRAVNRSSTTILPPSDIHSDLVAHGAYHFLQNAPYDSVVQTLLYEIALDAWDNRRSNTPTPLQRFFSEIVSALTDDKIRFHSAERSGGSGFMILVQTEGNEEPLPIQNASQGTLSVIAMFGLVRSYLKALHPSVSEEKVLRSPGIVIIDEIDAHLHPKWQMRMTGILRRTFPHVQFIVSAHSPFLVTGCVAQEVAVLRKRSDGFAIDQNKDDFIGADPEKLMKQVFEIDEFDDTFRTHPIWRPLRDCEISRVMMILVLVLFGGLGWKAWDADPNQPA